MATRGWVKPWEMFSCLLCVGVPVIQKQVMEKTCPCHSHIIPVSASADPVTHIRYLDTVSLTGSLPMLNKLIHGLKHRIGPEYPGHMPGIPDRSHISFFLPTTHPGPTPWLRAALLSLT